MIERIEFTNYKALRSAVLPLGRFTLIVGPNGSGKTTAIRAITSILSASNNAYEAIATAGTTGGAKLSIVWAEPNSGLRTTVNWIPGKGSVLEWLDPEGRPIADARRTGPLQNVLQQFRIYNLDSQFIARPVTLQPSIELESSGAGLAGVLDRLRDASPERFEALNADLARWFGEYDRVVFVTPSSGMRAFELRTRGGQKIPASQCSQGTLFALTILTLAHLPDPPQLVAFEEPDHGLHPRLLRDVRDAFYRLSYPESFGDNRSPVQVIATSHSPYLLDLLKDHPEEVVIAQKHGPDASFERLSDHADIGEILDGASLGEVWYTGILGGVPAVP